MTDSKNSNLRIVFDSAGDVPGDWLDEYSLNVIPINIHFGEKLYLQGIDLSNKEFYQLASESREFPKTSQPTPQQFIEFYRKIAHPGDTILSLHVTGKLSGTLASAQIASRELTAEYNIIPIDSRSGSAAMGFMAREARLMERGGAVVDEIVKKMEHIASQVQIVLTLRSLEFARRSGRVKPLQAALASLLNVKPVIILKNGELEVGDRVRTRRKALEFVVEQIGKRVGMREVYAAVVHAEDLDAAEILKERVRSLLNIRELIMTELSIGVAANLGPGTAGLVAFPVED